LEELEDTGLEEPAQPHATRWDAGAPSEDLATSRAFRSTWGTTTERQCAEDQPSGKATMRESLASVSHSDQQALAMSPQLPAIAAGKRPIRSVAPPGPEGDLGLPVDVKESCKLSDPATPSVGHRASENDIVAKELDENPLQAWRSFVCYARGHVEVKSCWSEVVSNWQGRPNVSESLELGKMINILVPRPQTEEGTELRQTCLWNLLAALIFHPNSRKRMAWDTIGVLILMHDLFMLPMSVFNEGTTGLGLSYEAFLKVFDLSSACFWTVDMVVSFFTGYFTNEGCIELRLGRVARHYLRSWFSLDLFIVCTDWVSIGFNNLGNTSTFLRLGKTVSRIMRILRLLRFMKLNSTTMRDLLAMINSEYVLTLVALAKILLLMVILNHYLACFWFYLSFSLQDSYHTWTVEIFGNKELVSLEYAYFTSLHWSLTQFTPASSEVMPKNFVERGFNIVVIIFALVIFSSFVSGITQAMTHIRNINSARTAREGEIRAFLSSNKISPRLTSRIWRFVHQYNTALLGQRRLKQDDIALLKMLPVPLKEELWVEVCLPILVAHPFFREYFNFDSEASPAFCRVAVKEESLQSGQMVFQDLQAVKEMVFVIEGTLEYHSELEGEASVMVSKGEWACELALWAVKATLDGPLVAGFGGSEVLKVNAEEVQRFAQAHPESSDFLGRYAKIFIRSFNCALLDENAQSLFNDPDLAQKLVDRVLKQCSKARGFSTFRQHASDGVALGRSSKLFEAPLGPGQVARTTSERSAASSRRSAQG